MSEHHIASAFDRDLAAIAALLIEMGGLVGNAIASSAEALSSRDEALAQEVRAGDAAIDALEDRINIEAARLIALRQPMSSDLRAVLAVMKIASNLERVGDYSKNLAKRTGVLVAMPPVGQSARSLRRMAREVEEMLRDALESFMRRDAALAGEVRGRDLEVDQIYNALFRELLTHMMEDPRSITAAMHLHFIAKNIERMGDHVTSIAEEVIYLVTGSHPEEARPKATAVFDPAGEKGD